MAIWDALRSDSPSRGWRADETNTVDHDKFVLQGMHIGDLHGRGVTVRWSFRIELCKLVVSGNVNARH